MIEFTATIKKFKQQGEKTGWTYIDIPLAIAQQLKENNKQSFRVKGKLDACNISGVSLLPMGEGNFIMPLNGDIRKKLRKNEGAFLQVILEIDTKPFALNKVFLDCLQDEPKALKHFQHLPSSHQKYYSKWIDSAKTEVTKAKRIAQAVTALSYGKHYGEMMRSLKEDL